MGMVVSPVMKVKDQAALLRATMDCIANDRLQTAPQRVAHYLLSTCEKDGGPVYVPQNKTLKAAVENVVKDDVWPTTKFICSDEHISKVCEFVANTTEEIDELIKKNPTKKHAIHKAFEEKYGDLICTILNQHRTNCQANVKKWWQKREQEGKPMPTIDQLREIIMRKGLKYDDKDPKKNLQNRHW